MEHPRHDLPTLHRPVTVEELTRNDTYSDLSRQIRPVPTPPHKQISRPQRPQSSSLLYQNDVSGNKYGTLPSLLTETNWRARRAKQQTGHLPASTEFDQSYRELSSRKAYRYPHPGAPKGREGCMGGTWRHTKEAIGYGPGRLMWVDGIVTLYDDWTLNSEKPWNNRETTESDDVTYCDESQNFRTYAPSRRPMPIINTTDRWYTSNRPQPLLSRESLAESRGPAKYKGFYSMAQTYS